MDFICKFTAKKERVYCFYHPNDRVDNEECFTHYWRALQRAEMINQLYGQSCIIYEKETWHGCFGRGKDR